MHGHLMKNFLNFMKADWEYGYPDIDYDPHEMMTYYLGEYYTSNGTLIHDPYNTKQYYLQYYNDHDDEYEDGYEDGYDSCG